MKVICRKSIKYQKLRHYAIIQDEKNEEKWGEFYKDKTNSTSCFKITGTMAKDFTCLMNKVPC